MGIFDFFKRKSEPRTPDKNLYMMCYGIAYFLIPSMLFADIQKMRERFAEYGDKMGAFFYVMACKQEQKEPVDELLTVFKAYEGQLGEDIDYYIVEYPVPPPINPNPAKAILAPYFSAIVYIKEQNTAHYYVLGQGLFGGTTFREVTATVNANMGEGCAPALPEFLAFLKQKVTPQS